MAMLKSTPAAPVTVRKDLSGLWRRAKYLGAGTLLLLVVMGATFYVRPLWVADQVIRMELAFEGVHSQYAQVGPYRVHYFVGGEGTPLLLVHGLGARAEDWAPVMPTFARAGFRVYAIDLLGCGRTDHPDIAYSIQQQVEMVHQFLGVVQVQQADVAGWSMGGWIAQKLAEEDPQQVQRLVLYDSAGLLFHASFGPEVFTPKNGAELARLNGLLMPHPPTLPGFLSRDILRTLGRNYWVVDRMLQSMLTGKDLMDGQLGNLRMPVLVAWGAQDVLIPPEIAEIMHQQMPQSVLELYAGCGHMAPVACAGRTVPNTIRFLQAQPPMTGGVFEY
ncbi:MAG: alpha/beta fold hydrolase [Acidobacteriaceae bacterium]